MKQLGDITKIRGYDVPPVNVIIGGSPCQDLSVAGRHAGLAGVRSCLFMEQTRVIKEMREADEKRGRTGSNIRPRFMLWENVPGAFSSNKGSDFARVLQETAKIVCSEAPVVPTPAKGWPTAGCISGMGDGGGDYGLSRGVYLMPSFGESPSVAVVSHLWQILEVQPPRKYYLSARACQGILNRAKRRGKELPVILRLALEQMIATPVPDSMDTKA